jgi:hypothetical protein
MKAAMYRRIPTTFTLFAFRMNRTCMHDPIWYACPGWLCSAPCCVWIKMNEDECRTVKLLERTGCGFVIVLCEVIVILQRPNRDCGRCGYSVM